MPGAAAALIPMTIAGMGALTADTIRKGRIAEAIRKERAGGKGLMDRLSDKVDATRGYITGYDTQQTPFEVAKERGAAGVLGGTIDSITGGMTDFDKRGDSKKQKDTKEFLRKFIFGTQGVDARDVRDAVGGGDITSFNTGTEPGAKFGYTFPSAKVAPNINILPDT